MERKRIYNLIIFFLCLGNVLFAQEIEYSHSIHHAFIENKGQWDEQVLFKSKFDGGNLWIQQNKFLFHFQDYSLTHAIHGGVKSEMNIKEDRETFVYLNFVDSKKVEKVEKFNSTTTYYNYFIGNDSMKWASDVHGFSEANLKDLYDGIDLKLIEDNEKLKYEFHVKPTIDPNQILLEYKGQKRIELDRAGNLVVSTDLGKIIENKPYSYQIINGKLIEVKCDFVLVNDRVSFKLGKYNSNVELIIDPDLIFATYSGSYSDNFGMTATYGHDGTAYSGGTVFGNAYPTLHPAYDTLSHFTDTIPLQINYGITDVFISKYSSDGTQMLWTTYLGGGDVSQGTETVHSLICDKNDNLFLFGATSSTDFPMVNAFQNMHGGGTPYFDFYYNGVYFKTQGTDIYVSKLSSNGLSLLGSTYVGGSKNDGVNTNDRNLGYLDTYDVYSNGYTVHYNKNSIIYDSIIPNYGDTFRGEIMLDQNGDCLIASCTRSTDFPILNAFQNANAGKQDGVLFKLSADLSTLKWSSYFGGANNDACNSVKIDSSFNVVFAGSTCSSDLLNTSAGWQSTFNGGDTDGFVGKLMPSGLSVSGVSYIGTTNSDQVFFVEIDRSDNVFLLGRSINGAFPVINAAYANPNSNQFICKLNPSLKNCLKSTTFGKSGFSNVSISPAAFLVDICGNMYVSGWGASVLMNQPKLSGMPLSTNPPAFQSTTDGFDFYLFVLDKSFNSMIYGSYIGDPKAHEHVDGGTSRFDKNGIVYQSVCGGCGGHSGFPTFPSNCWSDTNKSENCNNIVFKFNFDLMPKSKFTSSQDTSCLNDSIYLTNSSPKSDTYYWDLGNGVKDSIHKNPSYIYSHSGKYDVYLYVLDSICYLRDTSHILLTVLDSIQLEIQSDTQLPLCTPKQITLTAKNNKSADYFLWSSTSSFKDTLFYSKTDSTYRFIPERNGDYFVKVGNVACSKIASVFVETISSYLSINGKDKMCMYDQVDIHVVNSNPEINFQYNWSQDSVIITPTNLSDIIAAPKVSQYIVLEANDSKGCVFKDSLYVQVSLIDSTLVKAAVSDNFIPVGEKVTLKGWPSGYSYSWTPLETVENPNSQQTIAKPLVTTYYKLFVSDGVCSQSDSVLVKVFPFVCDDPSIFVPNAFSPNGDGNNDVLVVRGKMIKEMTFRIFDRWGELIFETHERGLGWDGTFKGKKMDPDVYDYYLKVTCIDDVESIVKGNITLLK